MSIHCNAKKEDSSLQERFLNHIRKHKEEIKGLK